MAPKKENAFGVFCRDIKPRLEREHGRRLTMEDVTRYAGPHWDRLTEIEKQRLKDRAKKMNTERKDKKNNIGVPIVQQTAEERRIEEEKREIRSHLQSLITGTAKDDTRSIFYIMCFNVYCVSDDVAVGPVPCEVTAIKFQIRDGIIDEFHRFILHDRLPLGYNSEAKKHFEGDHRIPYPPLSVEDCQQMLNPNPEETVINHLCDFICDGGNNTVFTMMHHMDIVKPILNRHRKTEHLHVFDLEQLLCTVFEKNHQSAPLQEVIVNSVFGRRICDHVTGMACQFHETNEAGEHSKYCTSVETKNLTYIFLEQSCKIYNVQMHQGSHWLPNETVPFNAIKKTAAEVQKHSTDEETSGQRMNTPPLRLGLGRGASSRGAYGPQVESRPTTRYVGQPRAHMPVEDDEDEDDVGEGWTVTGLGRGGRLKNA